MDRDQATKALELLGTVVRQARDDTVLQNWGVIWIFHAFTNFAGFFATHLILTAGEQRSWVYASTWSVVLAVNIGAIFVLKSRTAGARSFIESQIWTIWLTFVGAVVLTAVVNYLMGLGPFSLAPIISVLSAVGFASMAGVMGRRWFLPAATFAAAAVAMALAREVQFVILAAVWGGNQLVYGLLLHREKRRRLAAGQSPRLV